jgi:hypothetical protein
VLVTSIAAVQAPAPGVEERLTISKSSTIVKAFPILNQAPRKTNIAASPITSSLLAIILTSNSTKSPSVGTEYV